MANLYWPELRLPRSKRQRSRRRRAKWDKAEALATKTLVVSHAHCLDGVGSAIIAKRSLGADVSGTGVGVAFVHPGDMAEVLSHFAGVPGGGRLMLIADLSLQKDQLSAITVACSVLKGNGWRIHWRDHHHKQWEGLDLSALQREVEVLEVERDAKESGASLVQRSEAPKDAYLAALAATIRDRDLWWNKTPDSETLEFALSDLGTKRFMAAYLALPADVPAGTPVVLSDVQAAADAERARQKSILDRILANTRTYGTGDQKVGVVYGWLPKNTGLHELIADGHAIAINIRPNGKMSLRSRKGADVCHRIGQRYNGGGHPNASGADLGLKGPKYWWYLARKGKVGRVEEIAKAALEELAKGPDPPGAPRSGSGSAKAASAASRGA